ncbi:hypothetical protein D3C80_1783700 [compost metagenome]
MSLGYVMELLALLDGARTSDEFSKGLACLIDNTAWTAGEWNFGENDKRNWKSVQNVNRDIVTLAQYLVGIVRADIKRRRSQAPDTSETAPQKLVGLS